MKRGVLTALATITFLIVCLLLLPSGKADTVKKEPKAVAFSKDVAPIFFKNCAECHRAGEAAPFSVLSYKEVRPWAKSIREKVVNKEMPPWHADAAHGQFKNDRRLSPAEIDTITAWVDGGAAEGNSKDLPPAPKFAEGWSIGQPDLILPMKEEYTVAAEGPDEYWRETRSSGLQRRGNGKVKMFTWLWAKRSRAGA